MLLGNPLELLLSLLALEQGLLDGVVLRVHPIEFLVELLVGGVELLNGPLELRLVLLVVSDGILQLLDAPLIGGYGVALALFKGTHLRLQVVPFTGESLNAQLQSSVARGVTLKLICQLLVLNYERFFVLL